MSLVIPPEYARDVSKHSGYLKSNSRWARKTLKGLWRAPENVAYLQQQLFVLVTHPQYVHDHLDRHTDSVDLDIAGEEQSNYVADGVKYGVQRPVLRGVPFRRTHTKPGQRAIETSRRLRAKRADFMVAIPQMIEEYVLPYSEDQNTHNPIMMLHYVNLDFLTTSAATIIQNPDVLDGEFRYLNPDTGDVEDPDKAEYQYGAESWNDGTWHPEHLFTNSKQNRDNPYWVPLEVEFWNGPVGYPGDQSEGFQTEGGRGPGNRYKHLAVPNLEVLGGVSDSRRGDDRGIYNQNDVYNDSLKNPAAHEGTPQSRYTRRQGRFSRGGQFPFWQTTVHDRPYDRDNSEALREGGLSDRRTQRPHGYRMEGFTRRSSIRQRDIPRQTHH